MVASGLCENIKTSSFIGSLFLPPNITPRSSATWGVAIIEQLSFIRKVSFILDIG